MGQEARNAQAHVLYKRDTRGSDALWSDLSHRYPGNNSREINFSISRSPVRPGSLPRRPVVDIDLGSILTCDR